MNQCVFTRNDAEGVLGTGGLRLSDHRVKVLTESNTSKMIYKFR